MSSPNKHNARPSVNSITQRFLSLANQDFCPWANRYVYWLKQPIGWLIVAAAACLLIGLFLAPQGWVMFAALTAVIFLGVIWPWVAIRGVSCRLSFNRRRATEGDSVQVTLSIKNSFPWPIWGLAVEGGFFSEDLSPSNDATAVALARVPGWATTDFKWEYEPHRRGLYPSGICRISSAFPFGIWSAHDEMQINSELIVWPKTVKLASIPPVQGNDLTATGILMNQAGLEGDVLAVRPYRRGDSLKHIHWPQTARHNRFIVCERQTAAHRRVEVSIDTDPRIHQLQSGNGSFEWCIRVGASLIKEFHEHGWSVTYTTERHSPTPTALAMGIQSTFDNLAVLQPVVGDDFEERCGLGSQSKHILRIVVTTSERMAEIERQNGISAGTRFVVLQTTPTSRNEDSWLTIDCEQDIPTQLQTQWERLCHESWSAA
ncbi:DUF58 domain-containing protein [Pirellulaceae bacterium]|nr:DUF58 domain-containing protein [Pirellulaceae bacterium]